MTTVMNRREFTAALAGIVTAPGLILKEETEPEHPVRGEQIVEREAGGSVVMAKARLFMPGDNTVGLLADAVDLSYTLPYQLIKGNPYDNSSWYYSLGRAVGKVSFKHVVAPHDVWQRFLQTYGDFTNKNDLRVESAGPCMAWDYRCSNAIISNMPAYTRTGDMAIVDGVCMLFEKLFTGSDF